MYIFVILLNSMNICGVLGVDIKTKSRRSRRGVSIVKVFTMANPTTTHTNKCITCIKEHCTQKRILRAYARTTEETTQEATLHALHFRKEYKNSKLERVNGSQRSQQRKNRN